jgi:hypothetical protein
MCETHAVYVPLLRLFGSYFTRFAPYHFRTLAQPPSYLLTFYRGEAACHTPCRNLRTPEKAVNEQNFHD